MVFRFCIWCLLLALGAVVYSCYEAPCADPLDPGTKEFRDFMMSLDGKYRFQELYVGGADSTALLDSICLRGVPLKTKDYDVLVYYDGSSKCRYLNTSTGRAINMRDSVLAPNQIMRSGLVMSTSLNYPGRLSLWMSAEKYNTTNPNRYTVLKRYNMPYLWNAMFNVRATRDTLTFTSMNNSRIVRLVLY